MTNVLIEYKSPDGKWIKIKKAGFDGPPPSFFNNRFIVDRKAELQDA
jgi:hypothetical protein